jgi:importin subunit beta-1
MAAMLYAQEDGQDEDSYNKSTEAAACLASIANTITDDILPRVVPWVQAQISSQNWHQREAAVMAFGCIMEGPSDAHLAQYIHQGVMDTLIMYLNDSEDLVKNSAAWTIRRITEFASTAINPLVTPLCGKLIEALNASEPATANHLCWAIHNMGQNVRKMCEQYNTPLPPKNPLSPVLMNLIKCLVDKADHNDANEAGCGLRATAYEALNVIISTADEEAVQSFIVPTVLPMFGERLNATFAVQCLNADDANTRNEWQSFYCGVLQTCINLMPPENLTVTDASGMTTADKFMQLFLQVFHSNNTTAAQEALLAVGSVCAVLPEGGFERYMGAFSPILCGLIAAANEPSLCMLALTTTSEIARAIEAKILPFCDDIVGQICTVLARPDVDAQISQVHDYIKPSAYSCIGDIAMAIGAGMEKYLQTWLAALQHGVLTAKNLHKEIMDTAEDGYDDDKRAYLDALSEDLFNGYTGIVQGLKAASQTVPGATEAFLHPVALQGGCLALIDVVSGDADRTESVLRTAVGLIGDLADIYGDKIKPLLTSKACVECVMLAKESEERDTSELGDWANNKLGNVESMASS